MTTPNESTPKSPAEGPHLGLCNPDVIFTPQERAELAQDLATLALKERLAEAAAAHVYLD